MNEDLRHRGLLDRTIWFCLENKLVIFLLMLFLVGWGLIVAPFDWKLGDLPRDPVPVDAIPDIGENQQIVFSEWMGRSPQDVEDQITYPLTSALLGVPGVKTVRSYSMFGFSTIYIIFKDDVDFYWSRSRVLERLNSLPPDTLPEGVKATLGPDATALGQIFWYTLEGRDEKDQPAGGWDLRELRAIQDYYVRYSLLSAEGIAEVASVGGYVKEYQIDVDPDAMRAFGVKLDEVAQAIRMSNQEVGASAIEINKVEYVIRGIGFIRKLEDIENAVIKVNANIPVYVKNVAHVTLGPALRGGALDKQGAEAVGGVVIVRYGGNPLASIKNVKKKIAEISHGLPKKTLPDGTVSQVKIVPFYDRTGLIYETLGTLNQALTEEILVTIIVIIIMIMHLRSSVLISGLLPLAVLMCFIAMSIFRVDANIVALSGIAIAIGTMVDMGIIICENILNHLDEAGKDEKSIDVIFRAVSEVGSAVVTAISTTIVGFLPVFTMQAAEGKLFKPLAFTKTFALFASVIVALMILPAFAHILFAGKIRKTSFRYIFYGGLVLSGIVMGVSIGWWIGILIVFLGVFNLLKTHLPEKVNKFIIRSGNVMAVVAVAVLLTKSWLPLGPDKGLGRNFLFVGGIIGSLMLFYMAYQYYYNRILRWCLAYKALFLSLPLILILLGGMVWLGFPRIFDWLPYSVKTSKISSAIWHKFPGLGKEFMPPLDEGSYLFMPTTMPHASIGEALDVLQTQDRAIHNIPEVESVVGKLGRAETPLDPAPTSMFETVINYKPEYLMEANGRRLSFKYNSNEIDVFRNETGDPIPAPDGKPYFVSGRFYRNDQGNLIPDPKGKPFRLWRPVLETSLNPERKAWKGIARPQDIWNEILNSAKVPGTTSAPLLQPIAARIVMLQSGMRAPMGLKVKGPDLDTIEKVGLELERFLKQVPSVEPSAVIADRIVGKPYLEIKIDREAIARYGINLNGVQEVIETAIGGKKITTTVEGRERYPVRVRYMRELRDNIESLDKILVPAPDGSQIPLIQLAQIEYMRGPQMIKSEDTFLVGYVLFDKKPGYAEVDVVEQAKTLLTEKIKSGEFHLPAGVSYAFAGSYENQIRAQKRLTVILPLALFIIFMILYFQFRSVPTTFFVFSGILVCWAGGFIMIWFYAQPWFLNFSVFGVNMQELFQVHPFNLSVAVWVGFLALFGIASDDGVVMATYLDQSFEKLKPASIAEIRDATVIAGKRRIRPCMMTTATTVLALIPILTSTGRGADIMVPMAIPSFGGMLIEVITTLIVPVLYSLLKELKFKWGKDTP
jgi:Cu(I)/Ag(I) efflux system membrane protein CusA/SilA